MGFFEKMLEQGLKNAANARTELNRAKGMSNVDLLQQEATSSGFKRAAAKAVLDQRIARAMGVEPKQKQGCYITTAVCSSFGKPDDCYELTMFRDFRDSWLCRQDDGEAIISEYYATAPRIVNAIDRLPNAKEIYRAIWDKYLSPCLAHIKNNEYAQCKSLYMKMVRELQSRFLPR